MGAKGRSKGLCQYCVYVIIKETIALAAQAKGRGKGPWKFARFAPEIFS